MPANASCIICPLGWAGKRKHLMDVLIDLPFTQGKSQLPPGFFDMVVLKQEAAAAHGNATTVVATGA